MTDEKNRTINKEAGEASPKTPADILEQWNAHAARVRQAAADAPRNMRLPTGYPATCRAWALRDYWTPEEAANLLAGCLPDRPLGLPGHAALDAQVRAFKGILGRADLELKGRWKKQIPAREFVQWAIKKRIGVPEPLLDAMGMAPAEPAGEEVPTLQSQRDRELCRAIARTLWDEHPEMTIAAMTRHHAIRIYGNGKQYKEPALRKWIKDLDPRPPGLKKGGRPRKGTTG
ncbi:MAG: hypothetical protein JJT90_10665 [Ectothiorhodospiraceae bacterium]|nr:hypothetical protein [Ectothiorhodospiraceae bacterium]